MFKKIILVTFVFSSLLFSKVEEIDFMLKEVASDLGVVWGMTYIDKNRVLFTQKDSKIGILDLKSKKVKYLKNTPNVYYKGQGGLLDVKKSPNFLEDRIIYFTYVKKIKNQGVTTLAKAKLINDELVQWKDLLVTKSQSDTTRHFGSRIAFDDNGHIFFTIGDRGVRQKAQELTNHAGTVLRLNLDGTIPNDNPYVNNPKALDEIYTYGNRNIQGIFYDKKTSRLWAIEHGPRGGDEINLIQKAKNYGWPTISYGKEYWAPLSVGEGTHKIGMEQPRKYYIPSIAPSSLIVYSGKLFKKLEGKLLIGALKLTHINIITMNDEGKFLKEDRILSKLNQRVRNIVESPLGEILFSTDSGKIYLLKK